MKFLKKYGIDYLLLSVILLSLSYAFGSLNNRQSELNRAVTKLSKNTASLEQEMLNTYSDSALAEMINYDLYWQKLSGLSSLPYEGLFYQGDSLFFWTQNLVIPAQRPQSFSRGFSFQKFHNGYYLVCRKDIPDTGNALYHVILLAPIKYEYITTNSYLKPHFSAQFDIANYFLVSPTQENGFVPVKDATGSELFYVGIDPSDYSEKASAPALILFLCGLILLVTFINQALNRLPGRRYIWLRPLILLLLFFCLYYLLSSRLLLPEGVKNWKIFQPELFASERIASSLGSLVLQLLFLFWACIYITNKVQVRIRLRTGSVWNYLLHIIGYFIIFVLAIYTVDVIRALVRDSKIQFAFVNPLQLDYYNLVGVVCISLIFICLFLLSLKIISILRRQPLNRVDNGIALLICTILAIVFYLAWDTGISGLWIMLWVIIFIFILPYFDIREQSNVDFGRLFLLLVFMSASGALLLQLYGETKEKDTRINYAKKLINTGDAVTEYLLTDLQSKIPHDKFIISYFKSSRYTNQELKERIQQLYFQEGFSRYNINYYPFNLNGFLHTSAVEDFGYVTENGMISGKEVLIPGELYHSSSPSGTFTYLAEYAIGENDSLLGRLYVELTANSFKSAGVYPELLLEEKDKLPEVTPQYSFAIYHNQHLIAQNGDYFYDYHLKWVSNYQHEDQFIEGGSFNHLIYNAGNNTIIVVSKKSNWFSYFTSYFSLLFVVFFIVTMVVLAFNLFSLYPSLGSIRQLIRTASLRTLIHGFFMVFNLAILLIVAYIAGWFFLQQFNDLSQQTVTDKMTRVTESVQFLLTENFLGNQPDLVYGVLKKNIGAMADVQDIDINFYNLDGDLITSSQPSFFEKGLISKKMNPVAYKELSDEGQTVLVKEENVGTLKFYSGYQSIRQADGNTLLFIHLPYFNSKANLNEQVGFFFVALVNILVLATILAGLLVPLISKQITRKLSLIGERFKGVRVGSSNELLEWHANDEIGSLVAEYNKMILQLETSAIKLAKSERELAWREMARQVAHEIKNPLTPMKLSIQHLQREYQRNSPNLRELTAKVSNTLIEQIQNLNRIANEFSNFAKMPDPDIETININDVLQSACDLYKENEDVTVYLRNYAENSMVSADKNQLLSVFNNLILNAIQAIPQEQTGQVNVTTENYNGQVVVSVSDNGVGISEDEGKRVFTPNFTTKSSGTGLGLAITKNIVENFGGTISFSSEKNIGTTFFVKLPVVTSSNN